MQYALLVAGLAGFTLASPTEKRDACSDACYNAYNTCRGQPGANRAVCASDFATCLGYSPFDDNGSLVTPTACSTSAYATASVSATPDACAQKCADALRACQSEPGSNKATCAADYATCLGYNPYSPSFVEPTACSTSGAPHVVYTTEVVTALTTYCPASTTITVNSRTYAVSSDTTLIITDCPCTVTKASEASYPPATPTPATPTPATPTPATPTPATPTPATPTPATPTPATPTPATPTSASSAPGTAPASSSATQVTGTTAVYSPTTTTPGTVVTAAADAVKPALALLALGAVALI